MVLICHVHLDWYNMCDPKCMHCTHKTWATLESFSSKLFWCLTTCFEVSLHRPLLALQSFTLQPYTICLTRPRVWCSALRKLGIHTTQRDNAIRHFVSKNNKNVAFPFLSCTNNSLYTRLRLLSELSKIYWGKLQFITENFTRMQALKLFNSWVLCARARTAWQFVYTWHTSVQRLGEEFMHSWHPLPWKHLQVCLTD